MNTGLRIRWADAYSVIRESLPISYLSEVVDFSIDENKEAGPISVTVLNIETKEEVVVDGIDLLVGADGRYSRIREKISKPQAFPIGVSNFRLLIPDTSQGLFEDMELIYNVEPLARTCSVGYQSDDFGYAASTLSRIGIMKMLDARRNRDMLYMFGNFGIRDEIPAFAKSSAGLAALFSPSTERVSRKGRYILDVLQARHAELHWARMQHTPPVFGDDRGRVLLLGDAAHAIVPTLGQGATLAIEDACVAAEALVASVQLGEINQRGIVDAIENARRGRRKLVSDVSLEASDHLACPGIPIQTLIDRETRAWRDEHAGFRRRIREVWRDSPICQCRHHIPRGRVDLALARSYCAPGFEWTEVGGVS